MAGSTGVRSSLPHPFGRMIEIGPPAQGITLPAPPVNHLAIHDGSYQSSHPEVTIPTGVPQRR
jgi:hypothetical protein